MALANMSTPSRTVKPAATAAWLLVCLGAAWLPSATTQTIEVEPAYRIVLRGTAAGITQPTHYKALAYAHVNESWWAKPEESTGSTLSDAGAFTISFLADSNDAASDPYAIYVVPSSFQPPPVKALPQVPVSITSAAVRNLTLPKTAARLAADAGTGGATTIAMTVPGIGQNGVITGTVTNLPGPAENYKGIVLISADPGIWWDKTHDVPTGTPQPVPQGIVIKADGSFSIQGWVSDPHDLTSPHLLFVVVPQSFDVTWPTYQVEGVALPQKIITAAVASVVVDRATGQATQNAIGGGSTGGGTATTTTPQNAGTTTTGGSTTGGSTTGGTTTGGATTGGATTGGTTTGGSTTGGATTGTQDAGTTTTGGAQANPAGGAAANVVAAPAGTGELSWPPTPAPTGTTAPANGKITWSGYTWSVKDSGGGAVGPGPNVFVGDGNFVWTDSWGLHQNMQPRGGCGGWASSEIILDHSLGYGVYLMRGVGPVDNLDPQVTWSPMFLWDDSGNAGNGWREVDFEHSRWGNGGDPTSSQFVLMPLRSGLAPGWKVRYATTGGKLATFGGTGQGGGGCNDPGADNFNGAAISKFTHVLRWFAGTLQWATYDGLWTLQTIQSAAPKLVASYTYGGGAQWIPDPGDNRVHANTWAANAGAPAWGRRTHTILNGFEFQAGDINLGIPENQNTQ